MGRSPCCSKEGLNRGAWTAMEDKILTEYIKVHGEGKWRNLPKRAGLKRCGKSCRLRWLNYLRPDIKRGNITHDEEELIIRLHNLLGNRWSLIAGRLPGRTDNEIKNYWNTNIGKKIQSAATSNTTCRTKPAATQPNLRPPSPNKTSPSSAQQPSKGSPHSHVVRTKATRCTKVVLLPPQDPQKPHDHDHHDNGYKPAADEVPSASVNDELVNDQTVADSAVALGDHEPLFPFVPDFDHHDESNNSQFMKFDNHHDLEIDEKFLSDFLDIDCLEMELSDCFPNGVQDYDIDGLINFFITSPCSSNNNNNDNSNNNVDLFSDQELLFGADDQLLQTGSTSNDHLIDANEIDWLQD